MNLPALQAQARLLSDIKATKTIAITVGAYFFCYVPGILYAALGQQDRSRIDSWFVFLSWYGVFFSSAVNPIIYYLRTNRFRSASSSLSKIPLDQATTKTSQTGGSKEESSPNLRGLLLKGVQAAITRVNQFTLMETRRGHSIMMKTEMKSISAILKLVSAATVEHQNNKEKKLLTRIPPPSLVQSLRVHFHHQE